MAISTLLPIIYCTIVIVLSGFTMWNLTWFVSNIKSSSQNSISQPDQGVFFPMMFNAGLVVLFIAQHSFLKTNQIGSYLSRQRITSSISRSIYVILTSVTLQVTHYQSIINFLSNKSKISFIIFRSLLHSGPQLSHIVCGS